jgi:hypothetical protein
MKVPIDPVPYLGSTPIARSEAEVDGCWINLGSEKFFRIANVDRMDPFLMSVVSSSDHWLFVASNGGLTAGRRDPDNALFPYSTEDKVQDNAHNTGSRTVIWAERKGRRYVWEPFNTNHRQLYDTTTNLYKNVIGNKLVFEELNHELELCFRYTWTTSDRFGFVRQSEFLNTGSDPVSLSVLDGIENILSWGASEFFQNHFSCLGDAYKQNELDRETGLGIYAFSSIPGDSAEPSEALRATICWSTLPADVDRLVSSNQLDAFRQGGAVQPEERACGRRGAYFVHNVLTLAAGKWARWQIVADLACGHVDIAALRRALAETSDLDRLVQDDVDAGTRKLARIVASADGLQTTGDSLGCAHHFSNVLFNVMRGGIFESSYRIPVHDLKDVLGSFNPEVLARHATFLDSLGDEIQLHELLERARERNDPDLVRHVHEYLPLSFSRRHGDPSRPWNRFSINVRGQGGDRILDYQGNWRDIFQNWEALCHSFPEFLENVICKFVNTTTADGYNPYRITKWGYEWEIPNPDEPWSNIGYWGDHQLIYLLKLLEMSRDYHPGMLERLLTEDIFVYAEVPYDIKRYEDLLRDPKKSIVYNTGREQAIAAREARVGLDGKYAVDRSGTICRANLTEKLLVPLLAKVCNFIPEGGFWLNTQRPEWNDANNALTGYGVSMVTLYYARRYVSFCIDLFKGAGIEEVVLNTEVRGWFESVWRALHQHRPILDESEIDDADRKQLLDRLGAAGEEHRYTIYERDLSGQHTVLAVDDLLAFFELVLAFFEHTIRLNRRDDGLYHAYNVMRATPRGISLGHLQEMLEGQVSVLSSGFLDAAECVSVLRALRDSRMYRGDQHSYTLYPDRRLPGFLDKNTIPAEQAERSELIRRLVADGNTDLVERDVEGGYHFNGAFHNIRDVSAALARLADNGYGQLVEDESALIAEIFESIFLHREFTGRSGTFYGYEGLGCIYWHMVSKLLLAVHECCLAASGVDDPACGRLVDRYFDIRAGLGFNKTPDVYGAFPTDPYSHTPAHSGAKQPGMTGQVKEEIITRWAELGLVVREGQIRFRPVLLRTAEFLSHRESFDYFDVAGQPGTLALEKDTLAFTFCQVPFVLHASDEQRLLVHYSDGTDRALTGNELDVDLSGEIFQRTGNIARVDVFLRPGGTPPQRDSQPPIETKSATAAGEGP